MAKLFQVVAVKCNNINYTPACTLYLNTRNVKWAGSVIYTDYAGATALGSQIIYCGYDNTFERDYISSDSLATIQGRMNAAFGTDVHALSLTKIDFSAPAEGFIPATLLSQLQVEVEDIWLVMAHPLNNDNSLIQIQNPTRSQIDQYRVADAAGDIETAANA